MPISGTEKSPRMKSSMPAEERRPPEIQGLEFDWIGSDELGQLAFFSTAGAGAVPRTPLEILVAHQSAIDDILAMPATTEAAYFPTIAPGLVNDWRLMAERGLYAYDCDPNGGPYQLVAAPRDAVFALDLPPSVSHVAARVACLGGFAMNPLITSETIDSE